MSIPSTALTTQPVQSSKRVCIKKMAPPNPSSSADSEPRRKSTRITSATPRAAPNTSPDGTSTSTSTAATSRAVKTPSKKSTATSSRSRAITASKPSKKTPAKPPKKKGTGTAPKAAASTTNAGASSLKNKSKNNDEGEDEEEEETIYGDEEDLAEMLAEQGIAYPGEDGYKEAMRDLRNQMVEMNAAGYEDDEDAILDHENNSSWPDGIEPWLGPDAYSDDEHQEIGTSMIINRTGSAA
ncbi:hypothetical protein A4X09_0g4241 [Tilletia walkeri]|uniref:Uncharacterized protein n=1 Tax=Tilletia walkeri TaxID=117179 RepID=A0A8X7N8T4_9BASI|nr:hypothetical protein A4X09_0g4241 [Tilletia walkeri]